MRLAIAIILIIIAFIIMSPILLAVGMMKLVEWAFKVIDKELGL